MFSYNAESRKRKAEGRSSSARCRARSPRSSSSPQPPAPSPRRQRRRGVLLLVVLSLLVLFLMVGTAFVITAKQSEKAAKAAHRGTLRLSNAAAMGDLLDEVLLQLVRDTNNPNSSLRFHSLLADMYGTDGFQAQITNVAWAAPVSAAGTNPTAGQMVQFELTPGTLRDLFGQLVVKPSTASPPKPLEEDAKYLSPLDSAYNGLVVTFLSGPAAGHSTRIIGYRPPDVATTANAVISVLAFPLSDGTIVTNPAQLSSPAAPTRILINGRPFNGTGFGLDKAALTTVVPPGSPPLPRLTLQENTAGANRLVALLPNSVMFNQALVKTATGTANVDHLLTASQLSLGLSAQQRSALAGRIGPAAAGGANEPYDLPDFQNMALARMPSSNPFPNASATGGLFDNVVLPSFHRPELLNYWKTQADVNPLLISRILFRPNWFYHPKFTGSNPDLAPFSSAFATALETDASDPAVYGPPSAALFDQVISGPWDVDNDNDGVRDSIWIDVGTPVIAGPHGKLVRAMAAILLIDLDGRPNVNTAGTFDLVGAGGPITAAYADGTPATVPTGPNTTDPITSTPRGVGYGPADISLEQALGSNHFYRILTGKYEVGNAKAGQPVEDLNGRLVGPGRYGFDGVPGFAGFDLMSQVDRFGWPQRASALSSFVSPPNVSARYGPALNGFGQLIFEAMLPSELPALRGADTPYEMDVSARAARGVSGSLGLPSSADAPFSLAELERALRMFDADAGSLPGRLAVLSGALDSSSMVNRLRITTDSNELPTPSVQLPNEMRALLAPAPNTRLPRSTADLVEMRVRVAQSPAFPPFPSALSAAQAQTVRGIVNQLLAPELADGVRLDVNRPLGNGRDDDSNGVVDEPGEELIDSAPKITWSDNARAGGPGPNLPSGFTLAPFRPLEANGDGVIDDDDSLLQRQLMARHLYVLALTLTLDANGIDPTKSDDQELARRMAQWAINAVDFRDPDNIMTAFEYDVNPFDGWDIVNPSVPKAPASYLPTAAVQLVWGAERPELVMTETLAWHDRRTEKHADSDTDDAEMDGESTGQPDASLDNLTRPRGAFFLELLNPWPANPAANADTHLVMPAPPAPRPADDLGVNLSASAVDGSPVWRLMIYKSDDAIDNGNVLDPDDPEANKRPKNPDRSVYLTGVDPEKNNPLWEDDGIAFFNDSTNKVRSVRPGRYMVIGSGIETAPNSGIYEAPMGDLRQVPAPPPGAKIKRIVLNANLNAPSTVRLLDDTGSVPMHATMNFLMEAPPENVSPLPPVPGDASQTVADVAIIDQVYDKVTGLDETRRLTVSEPAEGYPAQHLNSMWQAAQGAEGEYHKGPTAGLRSPIDIPLDHPLMRKDGETRLEVFGSQPDFSVIYLQRLANPLRPWNPEQGKPGHDNSKAVNPYLTVDVTSTNVMVFNGRSQDGDEMTTAGPQNNQAAGATFSSIQRGEDNAPNGGQGAAAVVNANVWSPENLAQSPNADAGRDSSHLMPNLPDNTLGFLNKPFVSPAQADPVLKRMQPSEPFPWLAWNNRPFVSGNELMLVPRSRSSQLLREFSIINGSNGAYDATAAVDNDAPQSTHKPFGHLLNFFQDAVDGVAPNPLAAKEPDNRLTHLYRMLEYVQTPSLFAGSRTWFNPTPYGANVTDPTDPRFNRQPPFNTLSEFRDPGKININAITSEDVWNGIFHGDGGLTPNDKEEHAKPNWSSVAPSFQLVPANPTFFTNPFRAPDAGELVPIPEMIQSGFDCGLLRRADPTSLTSAPLFEPVTTGPPHQYRDSGRNPYFRYQPITRLNNLVTTRSNVYAVWVTIGFFEVEEANRTQFNDLHPVTGTFTAPMQTALFRRVYPDGYMLAKEDGVETGDIRRMRSFYIIDRTMPAGFEPGVDHNVENVIRLRRRIE